ncbi:hypothetical protein [Streptomyces sp. NPDC058953]|uniref:hypothetical protein n=1 Tax=unclassified Streptomyces TaxID=2593676 RepID=UPI0036956E78
MSVSSLSSRSAPYTQRDLRLSGAAFACAVAQMAVVLVSGTLIMGFSEGISMTVTLAMVLLVYAPPVVFVSGALISLAYVLPVLALADWAVGRRGGFVRWWRAGGVLGLGALYAVPFVVDSPSVYPLAWALVCLSAVLPLLVTARADRADRPGRPAGSRIRLAPWLWGLALVWLSAVVIAFAVLAAP